MEQGNKIGYVYKLVDPITNHVHYIGKTAKRPKSRLGEHLYESKNLIGTDQETAKHKWIDQLTEKGLEPKIEIIEKVYGPPKKLDVAEKFWIRSYSSDDQSLLLNLAFNPHKDRTLKIFENKIYKPHITKELYELYIQRKVSEDTVYEMYTEELKTNFDMLDRFFAERISSKERILLAKTLKKLFKQYAIMLYLFGKGKNLSYNKLVCEYDSKFKQSPGPLSFIVTEKIEDFFINHLKITKDSISDIYKCNV